MIITVDTGGTKTLVASFDDNGKIQTSFKFPTPKDQNDYKEILTNLLRENFSDKKVEALVIALPGIIKDGVAIWCNNLGWKNFPVRDIFQGVLGETLVLVENDANLAGLSEARTLKPIPTSVLYVTISTGIGTGIITNGKIDPGLRLSEGGRTMVEFKGKLREWEDFASGKAIREAYNSYARDITDAHTWQEIADRISRGFLALIPVLQP
ncbi:MAG TPA: ROK family protein, partial [Candidatus Saccharimonadales bacterium]|nr:ROK family protein [Candidatus Saccharimonadales bacterium]